MGQPVTTIEEKSNRPDVVRFRINRSLTGMNHERYRAGDEVIGHRPVDELARRLFDRGGEEREKVRQEYLRIKQLCPEGRVKIMRVEEQFAVLVGGYKDMAAARKALDDFKKLPPPDKKADGIGVFDVTQNKLSKVIKGGSDPEEFSLSKDGNLLYISNEDAGGASIVDIEKGEVMQTLKVGEEPEGVETTPDGKFVYVACNKMDEIVEVDRQAWRVARR